MELNRRGQISRPSGSRPRSTDRILLCYSIYPNPSVAIATCPVPIKDLAPACRLARYLVLRVVEFKSASITDDGANPHTFRIATSSLDQTGSLDALLRGAGCAA